MKTELAATPISTEMINRIIRNLDRTLSIISCDNQHTITTIGDEIIRLEIAPHSSMNEEALNVLRKCDPNFLMMSRIISNAIKGEWYELFMGVFLIEYLTCEIENIVGYLDGHMDDVWKMINLADGRSSVD